MKTNKIFAVALAALTLVGFNACKSGQSEVEVESVTLDQKTLQIEVGATATLVATVTPEGAATVAWSSEDAAVASVDDKGVVTGVAEGQTIITATAGKKSARCIVKVGKAAEDNPFAALLTGSEYYVFALDAQSFEKLGNKVKDDFRINGAYEGDQIAQETTCVLEIWNTDLTDANWPATTGLNCFGLQEGWIAMNAANCAWGNMCGGLRQVHRTVDLSGVSNDHVLAIVYKTPANNSSAADLTFTLYGTGNSSKIEKKASAHTNGEWTLLEYKMSDLFSEGLDWKNPVEIPALDPAFYTLGITIAGAGQGVEVDAVLVYKK